MLIPLHSPHSPSDESRALVPSGQSLAVQVADDPPVGQDDDDQREDVEEEHAHHEIGKLRLAAGKRAEGDALAIPEMNDRSTVVSSSS